MLNTFENIDRHNLRRRERERHLKEMEAFAKGLEFGNESASFAYTGTLSGLPLEESLDFSLSSQPAQPKWGHRTCFAGICGLTTLIFLVFFLGVDFGEQAKSPEPMSSRSNVTETVNSMHAVISSLILSWGVTTYERLGEIDSPPAQAFDWLILHEDIDITDAATIRTRFALATLYFATGNTGAEKGWDTDTHWLSPNSVCLWYGVECSNDAEKSGSVKALNLSSNALTGTLPDEVGLLGLDIRTLDVSGNGVGGAIPTSLSLMTNLGTWALTFPLPNVFILSAAISCQE